MKNSIKNFLKRAIAYLEFTLFLLTKQNGKPTLIAFPSHYKYGSSLLRVDLIVKELKKNGWNAFSVPAFVSYNGRVLMMNTAKPDICFVQKTRHYLNKFENFTNRSVVFDIDDADFLDKSLEKSIIEFCKNSNGIIVGSDFLADWSKKYNNNVKKIWTGSIISGGKRPFHISRPSIIAWAQSEPLMYQEELKYVMEVLNNCKQLPITTRLRLYGIEDLNDQIKLRSMFNIEIEFMPFMPYKKYLLSLRSVAIGLSPLIYENEYSRGKSFGKILGYLDAKVPVIASDRGENGKFFSSENGIISNDPEVWRKGIIELIHDPKRRDQMAESAFRAFQDRLSIKAAAHDVDAFLRPLAERQPRRL